MLVFHTVPELTLVRRYGLAGNPWAIVHDERRRRLWVTLAGANRLAELTTGRPDPAPRRLRRRCGSRPPSPSTSDGVSVTGREQGVVQLLDPAAASGQVA